MEMEVKSAAPHIMRTFEPDSLVPAEWTKEEMEACTRGLAEFMAETTKENLKGLLTPR